jgi:hypothetical protein
VIDQLLKGAVGGHAAHVSRLRQLPWRPILIALAFSALALHIAGMAARDQWTSTRKCQKCGKQAEIEFSENDYPFMRKADLRVESITPGFKVRRLGDTALSTEIVCSDCGELAK